MLSAVRIKDPYVRKQNCVSSNNLYGKCALRSTQNRYTEPFCADTDKRKGGNIHVWFCLAKIQSPKFLKQKKIHDKTLVLRAFTKNNIDTVCSIQKILNILHLLLTRRRAFSVVSIIRDIQTGKKEGNIRYLVSFGIFA